MCVCVYVHICAYKIRESSLPCSEEAGHEADGGPGSTEDQQTIFWELCAQLCSPQVQKRSSNTGAGPAKSPEGLRNWKICHERAEMAQKLK